MNRTDLKALSRLRKTEAGHLLRAGHPAGAYYLAGYAVECALKACIAKQTRRHDFPDKDLANKAYVHNLEALVKLAGIEQDFATARAASPALSVNWAVVKDWKETSRYVAARSLTEARDFVSACTARTNGVLPWIRARW